MYWIRVVVADNAGNVGKSSGDSETGSNISTPSANTNPYNLTTSAPANLRSTTSLTITASATDNEQATLYYDLYWNGSSSIKETRSSTKGDIVTFTTITGLTKRTSYSWKVIVRDGIGGTKDSSNSCFTNCPGTDSGCAGGVGAQLCLPSRGHTNWVCRDGTKTYTDSIKFSRSSYLP